VKKGKKEDRRREEKGGESCGGIVENESLTYFCPILCISFFLL
jgi:hypothetical protein